MKTLRCSRCKLDRLDSEFYPSKRNRRGHYCKKCQDDYKTKWRSNPINRSRERERSNQNRNRPEVKEARRRQLQERWLNDSEFRKKLWKNRIKYKYRLTVIEYESLLVSQGNACAVCGIIPISKEPRLVVDHNHFTKKVRGLVCRKCNWAIGCINDSPATAASMAVYLAQ